MRVRQGTKQYGREEWQEKRELPVFGREEFGIGRRFLNFRNVKGSHSTAMHGIRYAQLGVAKGRFSRTLKTPHQCICLTKFLQVFLF